MMEMMYRISRSRSLWLAALDHILLTIGFIVMAWLAARDPEKPFSFNWRFFTNFFAFLTFIGFCTGVGRAIEFGDPTLGFPLRYANGVYFLVVNSVIVPVWLIWTGIILGKSDGKDFYASYASAGRAQTGSVEMSSATQGGGYA